MQVLAHGAVSGIMELLGSRLLILWSFKNAVCGQACNPDVSWCPLHRVLIVSLHPCCHVCCSCCCHFTPRDNDLLASLVLLASQVLSNQDMVFLRIANDRGWTYAHNPSDKQSVLFEKIAGEVEDDQ